MATPPISDATKKTIDDTINKMPGPWHPSTSSPCYFGFINREDGGLTVPRVGACHANLSYGGRGYYNGCIVVNGIHPNWGQRHKDFILWAALEGPFSAGTINRDNEYQLLNHGIAIDTAITGQAGALWLCKAIRHCVEDEYKLDTWQKLRERGLNGLQAFIGCDILDRIGNPCSHTTHVSLFAYKTPKNLRDDYDSIRTANKLDGGQAAKAGRWDAANSVNWGCLKSKTVKKPDGWGGYTEVLQPCDVGEYADKLKEIFEGDPNNVK